MISDDNNDLINHSAKNENILDNVENSTNAEAVTPSPSSIVKKQKNNKPKTYFPTCRFCGRQELPDAIYENQETANEAATIRCTCYKATLYQEALKRKQEREDNIVKLRQRLDDFGDYCQTHQVTFDPEKHDLLMKCGIAVLDGLIGSATLKWARLTTKITTNNKNALKITFAYSDRAETEV